MKYNLLNITPNNIKEKIYGILSSRIRLFRIDEMMKEKSKDNEEVTRDDCEEEEEEGEEVGKGDNSAAKTPVSLLQVDKLS